MTPAELVAAFRNWSPIVRSWAAEELAKRPDATAMVPDLLRMTEDKNPHVCQAACETLGYLKSKEALPVFVRLLTHPDRWMRFKAAKAIKEMGGDAKPVVTELLRVVAQTAEPLKPIEWADPVQLTHGQLGAALFAGPLQETVHATDPKLRNPAIKAISLNADGMARATLRGIFRKPPHRRGRGVPGSGPSHRRR